MPTKTSIDRPFRSYWNAYYKYPSGELISKGSAFTYGWNCDRVKTGTERPNWREIISTGGNATSNYSLTFAEIEAPTVTFANEILRSSGVRETWTHEGWPLTYKPNLPVLSTTSWNQIKGATVAKFYTEVANTLAAFKGLVFIGEILKTKRLLVSLLTDAIRLHRLMLTDVRDINRRIWNSLKRVRRLPKMERRYRRKQLLNEGLKALNQRYLEFTFGITPLLHDIESAAGVYTRAEIVREYINARIVDQDKTMAVARMAYIFSSCTAQVTTITKTSINSKCRAAVDLNKPAMPNPLEGTASEYGIKLRELVPALWELTPFSFLIDYYVNVSDLINTAMYFDTKFVYGVQSTKHDAVTEITISRPLKGDDTYWSYKVKSVGIPLTTVKLRSFKFERVPIDPSLATIRVALPTLGRRWLNSLSVLISQLGKKRNFLFS